MRSVEDVTQVSFVGRHLHLLCREERQGEWVEMQDAGGGRAFGLPSLGWVVEREGMDGGR